jgi:hypothetical protein
VTAVHVEGGHEISHRPQVPVGRARHLLDLFHPERAGILANAAMN